MSSNERDIGILNDIDLYCEEIYKTQEYFGKSLETFAANPIYLSTVSLCLMQIGELSGLLSDAFKESNSALPWRNIKGMRNITAHKDGSVSVTTIWESITNDIPVLGDFCRSILEKNSTGEE